MPEKATDIPGRLHALAKATGRPTRDIARAAGMDQGHLWRACSGRYDPRVSTVARILDAIGATWADLDH